MFIKGFSENMKYITNIGTKYCSFTVIKRLRCGKRRKIICELFPSRYVSLEDYYQKEVCTEKNYSSNALILKKWW